MGLSLKASEGYVLNSRPRYFDQLETYRAGDEAVLFQVHMRRKSVYYHAFRHLFKVVRWVNPDLKNPLPYEIVGCWDDEALAIEHCRAIEREARQRGVRVGVDYGPIPVNRAFPFEPVRWGGLTNPSAWFRKRETAPVERYELVSATHLRCLRCELAAYRSGRRPDCDAELDGLRAELADLRGQVADLRVRVDALEGEYLATGRAARPH